MKHINEVAITGEISGQVYTNSGEKNGNNWNNANFQVLTEIPGKNGSVKTYHSITAWGKVADCLGNASKGATVKIIGSLGSYKDKNEVWKTQITAYLIEVLSKPISKDDSDVIYSHNVPDEDELLF